MTDAYNVVKLQNVLVERVAKHFGKPFNILKSPGHGRINADLLNFWTPSMFSIELEVFVTQHLITMERT